MIARRLAAIGARVLIRRRAERTSTVCDDIGAGYRVREGRAVIEHLRAQSVVARLRVKLGMPSEVFEAAARPVIERYAEFVQLLPAAGNGEERVASSLLLQRMRIASRALDYRRGEILPRGAAPEVIGAQMHRWTYAVFIAAMLYDLDTELCGVEVSLTLPDAREDTWDRHAGSMLAVGALRYRIERRGSRPVHPSRPIALRLEQTLLPEKVRSWLGADPSLVGELCGVLGGDVRAGSGAIATLVLRARFAACPKEESAGASDVPQPRNISAAGSAALVPVSPPLAQTEVRPAERHRASRPGAKHAMPISPDMASIRSDAGVSEPRFLEDCDAGHGIDFDSGYVSRRRQACHGRGD